MFEGRVDLVRIVFVILSDTLAQEVVSAFLRESTDFFCRNRVNQVREAKFSLHHLLPLFTLVNPFSKEIGIFIEEKQ